MASNGLTRLTYDRDNFNLMMRFIENYIQNHDDPSRAVIADLYYRIRQVHEYTMSDGQMRIVIYMTPSDMANMMNVYESLYHFTFEAQRLMNTAEDWFNRLMKKGA